QTGETEFKYNGEGLNEININVPYGYDLSKVIPTFELVDGLDYLWVDGNTTHPLISGEREVTLAGTPNATTKLSIEVASGHWAIIKLTVKAVPKNPEGLLNSLRVYVGNGIGGWTTSNITNTTT